MTPLRQLVRADLDELERTVGLALRESRVGPPGDRLAAARVGAVRVLADLAGAGASAAARTARAELRILIRHIDAAASATTPEAAEIDLCLAVGAVYRACVAGDRIPDVDALEDLGR